MRTIGAFVLLFVGCERADQPNALPVPPPGASLAVVELPPREDPGPPARELPPEEPARPERVPEERELPVPPSDEPADYRKWLWDQPAATRHRIALFCRANPLDYKRACGGIGPYHVAEPPLLVPQPKGYPATKRRFGSREEWMNAMSTEQRAWVNTTCNQFVNSGELCTVETPLVIAFDDRAVEYTRATFAFEAGAPHATGWPTAATPWLALDVDGDGAIDHGAELFGNHTALPDGTRARDGFSALAALDANGDGRIDRDDPAFAGLVLWADRDGDGRSSPDELTPAASVLDSISLAARVMPRCDGRGNCERERAEVRLRDGRAGSIVDVYLH